MRIAQRWILARIRNQTFFSLAELNARSRELVADLNQRVMRGYGASRRELFERLDRSALRALPDDAFEYAEWKKAPLNIDYHADYQGHWYSAPHIAGSSFVRCFGDAESPKRSMTAIEVSYSYSHRCLPLADKPAEHIELALLLP